jgi:hypothetical protein
MQKQLITDQLIEEYQKELEIMEANFHHWRFEHPDETRKSMRLHGEINSHKLFITRLQSLRQQEVQNIKDAFDDGLWIWNKQGATYSDDYFTQTFEQKGGGNGK